MKAAPFTYHAPGSVSGAVALLAGLGDEAKVLAGGQSLLPLMAMRLARPAHLVDVGRLDALTGVHDDGIALHVGAAVRQRAVERDAQVRAACPLLAEALPLVGHTAIRAQGTVGGSLAHADPAAELPVVAVALGATLVAESGRGVREIPARDFFEMPFTTALGPDELLRAVRFPRRAPRTGYAFLEVARRHGDFPLAAVAAVVSLRGDGDDERSDVVETASLAFGGVGPTPLLAPEAAAALAGRPVHPETWADAARHAAATLTPRDDIHATGPYRVHVAEVLARRALDTAATRARDAA